MVKLIDLLLCRNGKSDGRHAIATDKRDAEKRLRDQGLSRAQAKRAVAEQFSHPPVRDGVPQ